MLSGLAVACKKISDLSMSDKRNLQREDTQFRLMLLLEDSPDLTQRKLARVLGVSLGSLNYCLQALITKGFVKVHNFTNSQNKFGYVYAMTPAGIVHRLALTGRFLARKVLEYEALKIEIEILQKVSAGTVEGKYAANSDINKLDIGV